MTDTSLTFHEVLAETMEVLDDRSTTVSARLAAAVSLSSVLLVRVDDLQSFVISKGLTEEDFQMFMCGTSNVTFH